eukprot:m.20421 g.20421  ORF g.20421 m.20421 type:complete len:653 (+) comp3530_c0_seq2:31-1989(+)
MAQRAKADKDKKAEWKEEDTLQAIVIADSFNQRFSPLTAYEPRTLLPLVNVCLLDYTLEFLTAAGVQEVILFCCSFADKIKAHVAKSKWSKIVTPVVSEKCLSIGDALREIDRSGTIRSNFILVTGDIVSNYKLGALEDHKNRLKADKDAVMTMLFKKANPRHPARSIEDDLLVSLDKSSGRLLAFETSPTKKAHIPLTIFRDRAAVDIRFDLVDTHIYICSPQVLLLFADNFDYQDMSDFIRGVMAADELEQHKIYTHILGLEYAARVGNLYSYEAVSRDIMHRWTYPIVPDVFSGPAGVRYKRNHVYIEDGVILSRACTLGPDVLIGSGTRVGRDGARETVISGSVIGRGCVIGAGVTITDSYIWDGAVIGDNCKIFKSILATGVQLANDVTVNHHSVIGHGVTFTAGQFVEPSSRLALESPMDDFTGAPISTAAISEWPLDPKDPDYKFKMWEQPPPEVDEDEPETEDEDLDEGPAVKDMYSVHFEDLLDIIKSRVKPGQKIARGLMDNIFLEIKSSRHAQNATWAETCRALVTAIVAACEGLEGKDSPKKMFVALAPALTQFATSQSQADALQAFEDATTHYPFILPSLQSILHALYEMDVLEEDAILAWFDRTDSSPIKPQICKAIEPFLTWLRTAEEEGSDDDDSD